MIDIKNILKVISSFSILNNKKGIEPITITLLVVAGVALIGTGAYYATTVNQMATIGGDAPDMTTLWGQEYIECCTASNVCTRAYPIGISSGTGSGVFTANDYSRDCTVRTHQELSMDILRGSNAKTAQFAFRDFKILSGGKIEIRSYTQVQAGEGNPGVSGVSMPGIGDRDGRRGGAGGVKGLAGRKGNSFTTTADRSFIEGGEGGYGGGNLIISAENIIINTEDAIVSKGSHAEDGENGEFEDRTGIDPSDWGSGGAGGGGGGAGGVVLLQGVDIDLKGATFDLMPGNGGKGGSGYDEEDWPGEGEDGGDGGDGGEGEAGSLIIEYVQDIGSCNYCESDRTRFKVGAFVESPGLIAIEGYNYSTDVEGDLRQIPSDHPLKKMIDVRIASAISKARQDICDAEEPEILFSLESSGAGEVNFYSDGSISAPLIYTFVDPKQACMERGEKCILFQDEGEASDGSDKKTLMAIGKANSNFVSNLNFMNNRIVNNVLPDTDLYTEFDDDFKDKIAIYLLNDLNPFGLTGEEYSTVIDNPYRVQNPENPGFIFRNRGDEETFENIAVLTKEGDLISRSCFVSNPS